MGKTINQSVSQIMTVIDVDIWMMICQIVTSIPTKPCNLVFWLSLRGDKFFVERQREKEVGYRQTQLN